MSTLLSERPQAAPPDLEKLLEIKPDKDDTFFNRGNALSKLGQLEEAIASYDTALEIEPDYYEAWYNRGITLLCLKRYGEAVASFEKTLELKRDDYEVWHIRGIVLWTLGRLDEAFASFQQAIQIKQNFPEAWIYRGNILGNLGYLDEAITSYDKALNIQPNFPEAWHNRAIALLYLGRYKEAIASFDQTTQITSDFPEAWNFRGVALSQLGHYEEALSSYDEALKIKPNFPEACYDRGNALSNLRRYEEAITSYDKATELKPDYHEAWYNRGNLLKSLGRLEQAITSYDKAIEFKPDSYQPWNNRGNALKDLGCLDEALISFDKALEIKPDLPQACYKKAACYALQGNVEQAIENLQQAINLSPDEYREMAKAESDFDSIREDEQFQALIQEESDEEKDVSELRHNISWEEFENILAQMGDNRSSRVAYDQGTLEITMPSQKHEYYKEIIRDLIKYLAEELDLDCESLGSTTWKRKDILKGAEPDNCFYIQNEPAIRGVKPNIDLSKDPPPDLILEVDHTSPSLNRLPIYAGLGVPELWIYDMKVLCMYQLEAGKYKETDTSLAFGTFPIKEIPSFIKKNITASPRELRKSFRAWVGQYLTATPQETEWEDGEIDEHEWLRAATSNPAFDFLKDPEEDIYTLADGKPFND